MSTFFLNNILQLHYSVISVSRVTYYKVCCNTQMVTVKLIFFNLLSPLETSDVNFAVSFMVLLVRFMHLLVSFALLLVNYAVLLVSFALLLVNYTILLVSFALLLVNYAVLLVSFTFTRELCCFTCEFRTFTREFHALTHEFHFFTSKSENKKQPALGCSLSALNYTHHKSVGLSLMSTVFRLVTARWNPSSTDISGSSCSMLTT